MTKIDKWTTQLMHLRRGMAVQVSIDDHDDGREFVRLEFGEGGYITLELGEDGVGIAVFNAEGDVLAVNGWVYEDFASTEVE